MDRKVLLALGLGALIVYQLGQRGNDPQDEDLIDSAMTKIDELTGTYGPAADMQTSWAMINQLKRRESLKLQRYTLGDGGYTIGYGHFEKNIANIPATITLDQAEALFQSDIVNRAEKWVKLYIAVPITQNQFDALASIAYNMSPQSFKKFADQVNAGNGIDGIAEASISWVRPELQNGIRNRRNDELQVFNDGIYA